MKVKLTSGNRVVIPKETARELGIEIGDYFDLKVENGIIIITPEKAITKDIKPTKEVKTKNSKPLIINKIKIVSNLEAGETFSNKVYSDCKLVIRTKRSYLKKFCEACQGQLARENGIANYPCPYINISKKEEPRKEEKFKKENPVKNIIKKLNENVTKLDKKIDKKIDKINKEFP